MRLSLRLTTPMILLLLSLTILLIPYTNKDYTTYAQAQLLQELVLSGVDVSGGDVVAPHLYVWSFGGAEEQFLRVGWGSSPRSVGFAISVKSSWPQTAMFMVFRRRGAGQTVGQFDFYYGSRPAGWIVVARFRTSTDRYLDDGAPDPNVWSTFYVDYNASFYGNMYIYEKNVIYTSSPPPGETSLTTSTEPLYIGARGDQTSLDDVRNVFNGYIRWFALWNTETRTTKDMIEVFKTMIERKIVYSENLEIFLDPTFYDSQNNQYTDIAKNNPVTQGNPPPQRIEDEEKWLWLIKNLYNNTKLTFKHLDQLYNLYSQQYPNAVIRIAITSDNQVLYEKILQTIPMEYSIDLQSELGSIYLSNVTIVVQVWSEIPTTPTITITTTVTQTKTTTLTSTITNIVTVTLGVVQKAVIFPDPYGVTGQAVGSATNKWATVRLTYVDVVANLWNIPSNAQGQLVLTVEKDKVVGEGSFTIPDTTTRILGGPGFRYGINLWGSYPPPHGYFNLPIRIKDLPPTNVIFNISVDPSTTAPITINYYLWIPKEVRSGGTQKGDLLLSIQMYRDSRAGKPAGNLITSYVLQVKVNNTIKNIEFEVYAQNIDQSQATHTLISFLAKEQYTNGRILLPIKDFIDKAIEVLTTTRPDLWSYANLENYVIQMIDLFVEPFSYQGQSQFKWIFYEYTYEVGAPTATPTIVTITKTSQILIPTTVLTMTTTLTNTLTKIFTTFTPYTITMYTTTTIPRTTTTTLTSTITSTIQRTQTRTTTSTIVSPVTTSLTISDIITQRITRTETKTETALKSITVTSTSTRLVEKTTTATIMQIATNVETQTITHTITEWTITTIIVVIVFAIAMGISIILFKKL